MILQTGSNREIAPRGNGIVQESHDRVRVQVRPVCGERKPRCKHVECSPGWTCRDNVDSGRGECTKVELYTQIRRFVEQLLVHSIRLPAAHEKIIRLTVQDVFVVRRFSNRRL